MVRLFAVCGLVACALSWSHPMSAQGEKTPEIKEIMAKLNKPTGIYFSIVRELKSDEPDWDEVKSQARTLDQLAAHLPRNLPPKGDRASWTMLAKDYAANAHQVQAAVQKMDRTAAMAALDKMGGKTCMTCHKTHRQ
jgi:cytochrome c556